MDDGERAPIITHERRRVDDDPKRILRYRPSFLQSDLTERNFRFTVSA